jgi:hypothetical protein
MLNAKQKFYGDVMAALKVDDNGVATYNSVQWKTPAGIVKPKSLTSCKIG